MINIIQTGLSFALFLKEKWGDNKPVCRLFRTASSGYLYDTGTNKILKCSDVEYNLINSLLNIPEVTEKAVLSTIKRYSPVVALKAITDIENNILNENILLFKGFKEFKIGGHFFDLEHQINNKLKMILLEVTNECNLRCGYCVYNKGYKEARNHGTETMNKETAIKAIDYLADHSKECPEVSITFYGGEPLLNYDLIQSCVEYANAKFRYKDNISYSITTNATLINRNIAKYLFDHNFGVMVSIDGPADIHNKWRLDRNGKESFSNTIKGLQYVCNEFKDQSERIALSMVYAPPYSENKIYDISGLWKEYPWIPSNIKINITYPTQGTISSKIADIKDMRNNEYTIDRSLFFWAVKRYLSDYKEHGRSPDSISNSIIERDMARIYQRPILKAPIEDSYLNGCCIPAVRKLYVNSNGVFQLCERVGKTPAIGDMNRGIDIKAIKKIFIEEYARKSIHACSRCWMVRICDLCYMHTFKEGIIDMKYRSQYCRSLDIFKEDTLRLYCMLSEINPKGLDHFSEIVFS